jgi:phospholipid-binding lipoprotein MlaA
VQAIVKFSTRTRKAIVSAAFAALVVGGCATPPPADDKEATAAFKEANDPYEPFNRTMLEFNLFLDRAILRPVSYVYKEGVPEPIRTNIHNFLENLRAPITFANDVMQGEMDRAGNTLLRFGMNSTFGVIGINDLAAEMGFPKHEEDFGQTMATWEVDSGPYLVLPIFGPSNPRDGMGLLVDSLMDPFRWTTPWEFRLGVMAGRAVDKRARNYDAIEDLQKNSLDLYAAVRSLYRQRRADEIRNGAPTAIKPVPGGISASPTKTAPAQQSEDNSQDK